MPRSDRNSIRNWVSPSNVAMVTLVGFLSVGYMTDWKMLRDKPASSAAALAPGSPKRAVDSVKPGWRHARSETRKVTVVPVDPRSAVADRRAVRHDGKHQPELD